MDRGSKKFKPGRLSQILVPTLLILLTLGLVLLLSAIVLSLFQVFP